MRIQAKPINDDRHLQNLYNHMDRSGARYDAVRAGVQVEVLKPLTAEYNENMFHAVLEFDNFAMAHRIGNYILLNLGSPCYAMTVVAGTQPDGSEIAPCIHIIFDVRFKGALSKIVNPL